MAWYEQLDLDLGLDSIQGQFNELVGEASNMMETAHNLDILNFDAMAEQDEQEQQAMEDEYEDGEEYEDEDDSEVIQHDNVNTQSKSHNITHGYQEDPAAASSSSTLHVQLPSNESMTAAEASVKNRHGDSKLTIDEIHDVEIVTSELPSSSPNMPATKHRNYEFTTPTTNASATLQEQSSIEMPVTNNRSTTTGIIPKSSNSSSSSGTHKPISRETIDPSFVENSKDTSSSSSSSSIAPAVGINDSTLASEATTTAAGEYSIINTTMDTMPAADMTNQSSNNQSSSSSSSSSYNDPSSLDDSFAWDKTPKLVSKVRSKFTEANSVDREESTQETRVQLQEPAQQQQQQPAAKKKGKKVKPLKRKPKNLDFFGVGSSNASKSKSDSTSVGSTGGSSTAHTNNCSMEVNPGAGDGITRTTGSSSKHEAESAYQQQEQQQEYFGPIGLFGDETYVPETTAIDTTNDVGGILLDSTGTSNSKEPAANEDASPWSRAQHEDGNDATTSNGNGTAGSSNPPAFISQGWLSGITIGVNSSSSSATARPGREKDETFFDNIDEEIGQEEDPILKQVELNRTNPSSRESNITQAMDVLNNLMNSALAASAKAQEALLVGQQQSTQQDQEQEQEQSEGLDSGGYNTTDYGNRTGGGGGGGSSSSSSMGSSSSSSYGCSGIVLRALTRLSGVRIVVFSAADQPRQVFESMASAGAGAGAGAGTAASPYDADDADVDAAAASNGESITVQLHEPVDRGAGAILKLLVQVLWMLMVTFIMTVVSFCSCIQKSILSTIGGSTAVAAVGGSGASSVRMRRFFTSSEATVESILGTTAPQDQTWQDRANGVINAIWEQLNTTNGITVITGLLLMFSYYKFRRYGTDAGD